MTSLTYRLAVRLTIVLLAAVALAGVAVGWRALVAIRSLDDHPLQAEARTVARSIQARPDGQVRVDLPAALAAVFASPESETAYLVTTLVATGQGVVAAASDPDLPHEVAGLLPSQPGLFRLPETPGHPSGLIGYAADAGPWRVFVVQGREQMEALAQDLVAEFLSTGLLLLLGIGGVAILIGTWTVRRGLAPARAASAAALAIGPLRPGLRLPEAGQPAEIAPLVRAVNQAVARLEAALAAQRRFVGDAAHTLRTPLAVLTARLDALPDGPEKTALRHDADRMTRLVGQMLQMARIEGAPLDVSGRADLLEVAREVIAALAPLAVRRHVELALTSLGGNSPVRGNRSALAIAVQNLVENAISHAPRGSTVEIVVSSGGVAVLDRGAGVPAHEQEAIFRRFQRGRAAAGEGAGLGLAIVAEIAASHGGSVQVAPREGGGSVFTLDLVGRIAPFAAGEHRQNQVLPMQVAGDDHAADMHADQDHQQVAGDVVQAVDPGDAEIGVGRR